MAVGENDAHEGSVGVTSGGSGHRAGSQRAVFEQDLYRRVFDSSSDGLIINDPTTGRVVEANPAVCRMHGYTHEEFIGIHGTEFIHPKDHPVFAEFLETIVAGGTFQTEAVDIRKDGTAFHVEVHGSPIMYDDRLHILAVVRDVTHRLEAEHQYRSVFEATHDCLTIYDANGFIVEANPAACEVTGYTRDEIVGLHFTDLTLPEYHALVAQSFPPVLAGESVGGRGLSVRKDGTPIPTEGHATRIQYRGRPHVLMAVRDITERVRAEEELEQRVADRTRELATLLEVSHTVTSTLELQPLLEVILDQLKVVAESDGATVLALRGDDLIVLARRSPGLGERDFPDRYSAVAHGVMWDLLGRGEPVIIDDVRGDDPLARAYQAVVGDYLDSGFSYERSFLVVPMLLQDRLVGLVGLSSGQLAYFTPHHATLAQAIAQQAAVAIENARLYRQAQELAVVEERQRLSRELHDSVSQALYSIALGTRTALALLGPDSQAREPAEFVLAQAERGLADMRALIFELRPEALEQSGLVVALGRQAETLRARYGLSVEVILEAEPDVSLQVKEALYRIGQEALHNTVKHARARHVRLSLFPEREQLVLAIEDDGEGFDAAADFPGHYGLKSMQERGRHLGGTTKITSSPGAGTRIEVAVPLLPVLSP